VERALLLAKENELDFPQSADAIPQLYRYWKKARDKLKHPLNRVFWKSDITCDFNLRLVFAQHNETKMHLRNSRKNAHEIFQKLKKLKEKLETS
jgi:hypothetical protein